MSCWITILKWDPLVGPGSHKFISSCVFLKIFPVIFSWYLALLFLYCACPLITLSFGLQDPFCGVLAIKDSLKTFTASIKYTTSSHDMLYLFII